MEPLRVSTAPNPDLYDHRPVVQASCLSMPGLPTVHGPASPPNHRVQNLPGDCNVWSGLDTAPVWKSPLLPPCRYPHDVVNHLSCDEARNHYGGIVSLIPMILDLMKEWIAHSEKLPRKAVQHVSEPQARQEATAAAAPPSRTMSTQSWLRKHQLRQLTKDSPKPRGKDKGCPKPPWRPPGGKL